MKVIAVLIIILGLVIIIVPQFTNCEAGRSDTAMGGTAAQVASVEGSEAMGAAESMTDPAATGVVAKMKCYWSAHAEIVAGVPLVALGVLLFFARRKETIRALGIITAIIGILTILIPTTFIGTCANDQMVCNTEMKPTLLVAGGITVALGIAALVLGERRREGGDGGGAPA